MIKIEIYAVKDEDGMVIPIEYDEQCDNIKLPPLATGWHYEIEKKTDDEKV